MFNISCGAELPTCHGKFGRLPKSNFVRRVTRHKGCRFRRTCSLRQKLSHMRSFLRSFPVVQGNLHLFNTFDLAIGESNRPRFFHSRTHSSIMSRHCFPLPIALYIIFVHLLNNAEIVSVLRRRIKNLTPQSPPFFSYQ